MGKQLIIAEKPDMGRSIAKVIGVTENKGGYMESDHYIVSWAIGHLISLGMPHQQRPEWKEWSLDLLPMIPDEYVYLINKETKKQFELLKYLIHRPDVTEIINAGDDGREGEYIQRLIYWKAGNTKPMKRLLIDSVSERTIRKGMENLADGHIYDGKFEAGKGRAQADYLIGMNISRLLSCTYDTRGLVIGRVKTPTTAMVVKRDYEIENHVPVPYWVLSATFCTDSGVEYKGTWIPTSSSLEDDPEEDENNTSKISSKDSAEALKEKISGQPGYIESIEKKKSKTNRPKLYNLSDLQMDCINIYGYTSDRVLEIVQSLYEKHKITTYPRTDSNYITEDLGEEYTKLIIDIRKKNSTDSSYHNIANTLLNEGLNLDKNIINNSKVTDHHGIIINENYLDYDLERLNAEEKNVLHLIVSRMLLAVSQPYEYYKTTVITKVENECFKSTGTTLISKGFVEFQEILLGTKEKQAVETKLNGLQDNMSVEAKETILDEKKTTAPKPYTEASLLNAMINVSRVIEDKHLKEMLKDKGIGTEATRSGLLKELFDKGYLERGKGKVPPIHATQKAKDLIAIAPEELKSPVLSAQWEDKLAKVERGECDLHSFLSEIETYVINTVKTYSKNPNIRFESDKAAEPLGKCPNCGADYINGKFGAYCKNKCGFVCSMAFGKKLTLAQTKSLIQGKKTLIKGLPKTSGDGTYNAYLIPKGISTRQSAKGTYYTYDYDMEFPKAKNNNGYKKSKANNFSQKGFNFENFMKNITSK